MGCVGPMWGVCSPCRVCGAHVGCKGSTWGAVGPCGVKGVHVGCKGSMWGVFPTSKALWCPWGLWGWVPKPHRELCGAHAGSVPPAPPQRCGVRGDALCQQPPSAGPDPKPTLSAHFLSSLPQLCGTGHGAASPSRTETERPPHAIAARRQVRLPRDKDRLSPWRGRGECQRVLALFPRATSAPVYPGMVYPARVPCGFPPGAREARGRLTPGPCFLLFPC